MDFDQDVDSVEDLLARMEDEVDLTAPKWRFKEQVRELLKHHPELLRSDAEEICETVIRTKCTSKRCACGEVAQVFDPSNKTQIYCGRCWYAKFPEANNNNR